MIDCVTELLAQLKEISPLPNDASMTEELIDQYTGIVDGLSQLKDPRSIEPFIASFGYGAGSGVYSCTCQL